MRGGAVALADGSVTAGVTRSAVAAPLPLPGENRAWDLLFVSESCKGERSVCQWLVYCGPLVLGEGTRPLVWDAETLPADQRCAVFGCWEPGVTVRSYGSSLESSAAANLFIQLVIRSGVIPGACRCCCGCAALVWCLCGHTRTAGLVRCFSAL